MLFHTPKIKCCKKIHPDKLWSHLRRSTKLNTKLKKYCIYDPRVSLKGQPNDILQGKGDDLQRKSKVQEITLAKYSNRHHRKIQGSCWQTIDRSWVKFSSQSSFGLMTFLNFMFPLYCFGVETSTILKIAICLKNIKSKVKQCLFSPNNNGRT